MKYKCIKSEVFIRCIQYQYHFDKDEPIPHFGTLHIEVNEDYNIEGPEHYEDTSFPEGNYYKINGSLVQDTDGTLLERYFRKIDNHQTVYVREFRDINDLRDFLKTLKKDEIVKIFDSDNLARIYYTRYLEE